MKQNQITSNPFNIIVIVAALGYFVDIYDLILFSIVRVPSLKSLGITDALQIKDSGILLINSQMIGMLMGGIVWGILGDKRGRLSVLFLTILLYSLANIANGFVQSLNAYVALRFIAGFGLAGELGIGITLVSEVMTKESRAWGTSLVSGIGIAGAVLAYLVSKWGWREAYWAGGVLGLLLLALRIYVNESGMFGKAKEAAVQRGNFFSLFSSWSKFYKYLCCIFVGIPVWFVIGILVTFSKELGAFMHVQGPILPDGSMQQVEPAVAILWHYTGASLGSVLTGMISQWLRSRKKALLIAITSVALCGIWYFSSFGISLYLFYVIIFVLGLTQGYWAIFVTVASEQFGTNIRSTVTTTVPNFVRGALALMTILWQYLDKSIGMGIWNSAIVIGGVAITFAITSVFFLEETYGKDLDYFEAE